MLSTEQKETLHTLCEKYFVKRLWLFGSAVTENFDPARSDIDLLVEFGEPFGMSPAAQFFDFWEELKTLFARDVELVERNAIKNPYFLATVSAQEQLLYAV